MSPRLRRFPGGHNRTGRPGGRGIAVAAALLATVDCSAPTLQRFEFSAAHMGTDFRIVLYAAGPAVAERAATSAFAVIAALDRICTDYDESSELCRLSATSRGHAPTECTSLGPDLWRVLSLAEEVSRESRGAFDVTVGPFVRLWRRARRQQELPDSEALAAASRSVGYRFLELDPERCCARLLAADMRLDLGGIAKGYAVDRALDELAACGVTRALVDGGGDLGVRAPPPGRRAWHIEVRIPGAPDRHTLELCNAAVATSGPSARSVTIGGHTYSHLVDPSTGLGLEEPRAATVVARDAALADAWASALCVLGAAGADLLARCAGIEARVVDPSRAEVWTSPGFPPMMAVPPRSLDPGGTLP